MRNFHFPGRSLVHGRRAMCATSHPMASLTAIEVLKGGGNAVDAAIATAAVLAVVEPHMTGIGGDCFALIAKPGVDKPVALSAAGRAPAGVGRPVAASMLPQPIGPRRRTRASYVGMVLDPAGLGSPPKHLSICSAKPTDSCRWG